MPRKHAAAKPATARAPAARPSALLDTRIIYCGDCRDQLAKLPNGFSAGSSRWPSASVRPKS